MIVRLYIKQPLLNDICKNKSIMVIYMCFIYTKDFRGIVIGKLLFVEISIFLKSRRNGLAKGIMVTASRTLNSTAMAYSVLVLF